MGIFPFYGFVKKERSFPFDFLHRFSQNGSKLIFIHFFVYTNLDHPIAFLRSGLLPNLVNGRLQDVTLVNVHSALRVVAEMLCAQNRWEINNLKIQIKWK